MRQYLTTALILWSTIQLSFAQTQITSADTLCGHRVYRDESTRILGWYKPEIPGASYDKVVRLATEFLKNSPVDLKTGLPLYLVTCCFMGPHMTPQKNIVAEHWAHNPACVYAGSVQSLAVLYFPYTSDSSVLRLVKGMLDYQLMNGTTPAGWNWPKVPYASADPFSKVYQGAGEWEYDGMRGDGLHVIEPDKVGELGYAYLRFYEITGDSIYLNAAVNCADALAKHVRDIKADTSSFAIFKVRKSPWPFRVNARTGIVFSEYCSNVLEPVKLFEELLRIRLMINLDREKVESYRKAADIAWQWLYSKDGPMTTFIWNAYFEDIPNDPETSNRLQITPMELVKYLAAHPEKDKDIHINVPSLIYWVANAFKTSGLDAIKEQTWCYEPMGSHTARYGSACAMYYELTGNEWYKDQAYRFLNVASYMTYDNGVVAVGPYWPGSWFSDGYSDYIRHFLDAMGAVPDWAPPAENHLLRSSSVIQSIKYDKSSIRYNTFDTSSDEVLRLVAKPKLITVNNKPLKESQSGDQGRWTWKPLKSGGVVYVYKQAGSEVVIKL